MHSETGYTEISERRESPGYVNMFLHYCCGFFLLLCGSASFASDNSFPFQDPKLPWDVRVDDLVGRLTLEEIVNQSLRIYSEFPVGVERLNVPPYFFSTECLDGCVGRNATAFPQPINIAATFRFGLLTFD